ncbi:MAG: PglZ domain-containing protein [Ruminococcaceae bacterium]|nr:PglZ domain-containing protein [Oscillospiraceae bacterium]
MKNYILPDYARCNLNISSTLAEFLGAPNTKPTLPLLEEELKKGYEKIVFICFDGLGIYPLKKNLPENDLLRQNIKDILVSTFPSTTTNATTSLLTNKYPLEHGWFGWSIYFEEIGRNVDIFTLADSLTGEALPREKCPLEYYAYYFDEGNGDYEINTVFPPYIGTFHPERNTSAESLSDFEAAIKKALEKEGRQFVYAYFDDPDHTMHRCGVSSNEAKNVIESISKTVENLYDTAEDTLFIITADHGQIDVEGYVEFYKDDILSDMLITPPFMEPRAAAFTVKEERRGDFEKYFPKKYGEDLMLFSTEELIEKGWFGPVGDKAHLLGDHIAIGTYTHKQALLNSSDPCLLGHHTSLTEEMEVPLIILSKDKKHLQK